MIATEGVLATPFFDVVASGILPYATLVFPALRRMHECRERMDAQERPI
jgi:hypothetical protein